VFLTRKVFPGAQGSGIPQPTAALKMRDVADVDSVLSLRIAVGKLLLTLVVSEPECDAMLSGGSDSSR
jgi:H+/Cl- antiporter ClcA